MCMIWVIYSSYLERVVWRAAVLDRREYTASVVTVYVVSVAGEPAAVRLAAACSAVSVSQHHHCSCLVAVVAGTVVAHSPAVAHSAVVVTAPEPSVAAKTNTRTLTRVSLISDLGCFPTTVLSTSHWKTFFAWRFILNENILFLLTISYQKPFVFSVSVFCSHIFTVKLNLQPKIGLTYAISIVKWFFGVFV